MSIGGFDFNIDQHDINAMLREEETEFVTRMRSYGKVEWIATPYYHLRSPYKQVMTQKGIVNLPDSTVQHVATKTCRDLDKRIALALGAGSND